MKITNVDSVGLITASGVKFGESGTTISGNSTVLVSGEPPTRKLVVGDTNTVGNGWGATNGTSSLFLGDSDDEDIGALTYNHPSNFIVTVNASERLRITSGVNVDINGTPPWTVTGGDYRNLSISGEGASASGFLWLENGVRTNLILT